MLYHLNSLIHLTFFRSESEKTMVGAPYLVCGAGLKVYFEVEILEAEGNFNAGFAASNCRDATYVGKGDTSWGIHHVGIAYHRSCSVSMVLTPLSPF